MKNVYAQRSSNIAKTWLLILFMAVLVIGIGYFVSQVYGEPLFLYIAVILSLVLNISSYWFSDKIALAMHHARPADPNTDRELINLVDELAITAGLQAPRVYVIQDPSPNAFATGRNEKNAVIAVTTGLMSRLNRTELQGVLAHEMAHIGNKDILLSTIIVVLVGFVSIIADIFLRSMAFGGRSNDREGNANAFLMIFGVILLILSPIVATLIQLAVSRRREYLADATAALLTRYPEGLASALLKIEETHLPMRTVHQSTAHLFFADPVAADAGKADERFNGADGHHAPRGFSARLAGLFSTHPPIAERVKRLRQIA